MQHGNGTSSAFATLQPPAQFAHTVRPQVETSGHIHVSGCCAERRQSKRTISAGTGTGDVWGHGGRTMAAHDSQAPAVGESANASEP